MNHRSTAALVTGGSRGLGAALGEVLVEHGTRVVLVARGEAELARTVAAIRRDHPKAEVHGLAFDVGDKEAAHRIAGAAQALIGPIDVVVHAASVLGPTPLRSLLDTECEDFADVLQKNLLGPFRLDKILGGAMALRRRGTIVHVSSDAAVEAYPSWGAYGVSKAALDHLTRSFAVELASHGVNVIAFDPGEMDTAMHAAAIPDADRTKLARPRDVAEKLARLLEPERELKSGGRYVAAEVAS